STKKTASCTGALIPDSTSNVTDADPTATLGDDTEPRQYTPGTRIANVMSTTSGYSTGLAETNSNTAERVVSPATVNVPPFANRAISASEFARGDSTRNVRTSV